MDLDEIISRIERIRHAIRFDERDGELGYTKFLKQNDGTWIWVTDETELALKIQTIISEIAALKDPLIKFINKKGEDGNTSTYNFIGRTFELQLLLDLNNFFKHGPPSKRPWTNLEPKLVDLSAAGGFQCRSVPKGSPTRRISMNLKNGKVIKEGPGIKTIINGIIIGKDKQFICSLDQLIDNSVSAIEHFGKENGILK